ncbi:MAG TPA: hypothetical protein VKR06_10120 [Ktedonosporobacter sp.]|nr:hypothetical protein [Ktedonosporobacter sp.]
MDCLHNGSPSDEGLLGFVLDGEALPADAQSHLAHCPTCQQRMQRYQKGHASLVARFYRTQCPAGTDLSLYAINLLPQEDRLRIANHLIGCPLCKAEVEEARHFMQTRPTPSFALPPLLRRIFASLVPQLEPRPALRDDSQPSSWPRQYRAETVDLSLHLSSTSDGEHVLLGILTCADPDEDAEDLAGTPVELYAAPWSGITNNSQPESQPLLRTSIDDMGSVVLSPIPTGTYVMLIHLPDREMIIENLIIQQS